MANSHKTLVSLFTDIANSIRSKAGKSGVIVADNFPSEIDAIMAGGNLQEKTVTPTGEQFDVLPDAGYDALSKVTVAGDSALKPWNVPEGTTIYGVVGTAKLAVTTDPPSDLPVSKDDADAALVENDATADTSAYDLMVLAQDDGNITYGYLAKDTQTVPFTITSYDPTTTELKATGWRRLSYHTTGELAGTWTYDDFTDTESRGWNYLKNIRSCSREKLFYQGVEIWPENLLAQCLTFLSPSAFSIATRNALKNWDGVLEYSTDAVNWATWDGTTISAVTNGEAYALHLRGTGNTVITGDRFDNREWVIDGTDVKCVGNILNLLNYAAVKAGKQPSMGSKCFSAMFEGCTSLTQAPTLPATTLAEYCYAGMFSGCIGLTEAPALPATTLASHCYEGMFDRCTGLTKAPALPATVLADSCYRRMFGSCASLTKAPELPAITLAAGCYDSMFSGCGSLTQIPTLPATTLAEKCYYFMFSHCGGLTEVQVLPAMNLANNCYQGMFFYCKNLMQVPALPATTLAAGCYDSMFSECHSLTKAPELPATTLANECYSYMFSECTGLTKAPALPATTLANECYSYMFSKCTGLIEAPALPATTLANDCYEGMFSGCKNLTQAPMLPATDLGSYCYSNMFSECSSLTEPPELPATNLLINCYLQMFRGSGIKVSESQTEEYTKAYRIPADGTGSGDTGALSGMFSSTRGTFSGTPVINKTYYLSLDNTVVSN